MDAISETEKPGKNNPSKPIDKINYEVDGLDKGLMIVFNHFTYLDRPDGTYPSDRHGTEKDLERLVKTFGKIGYMVEKYTDKTSTEIKEILEEASKSDHSNSMSLIVVMLTHGGENGVLYTHDDTINVKDLWGPFTGDKCRTLSGKPKLFFIQACKGDTSDPGATAEIRLASKKIPSKNESMIETFVVPTLADNLLFYSTFEGFTSFRTNNGSWFIQSLCEQFAKYLLEIKEEVDLMKILTAVQRAVAFEKQASTLDTRYDFSKQMPTVITTLTMSLMFKNN